MSLRFAPLVPPHAEVSFISFQQCLNRAGNIQAHKHTKNDREIERERETVREKERGRQRNTINLMLL